LIPPLRGLCRCFTKFNRATWVGRNVFVRRAPTNNIRAAGGVLIELYLELT
jgi:hypothetical protein